METQTKSWGLDAFKLFFYSAIGIFMFFIPLKIGAKNTIPIDHIVTWIRTIPHVIPVVGGIMVTMGAFLPFVNKSWNKSTLSAVLSVLGIVGWVMTLMVIFKVGPEFFLHEKMAPFVFTVVVVPVIIIVPVGSVFLAFIVDYGLMEFIGILMRPVMTRLFKTPGRSAIDAVASFVGSYSIALLVTNGVYMEGKYNTREAAIIATGFSTVSATFMIITAKTLGLMDYWLPYFWITLVVTFAVTAITARLYPLRSMPQTYYNQQEPNLESEEKGHMFRRAYEEGIKTIRSADPVPQNVAKNLKAGFQLGLNIGPNIMSIGVISLLLSNYTPVFDILGYAFYPLALLLRIPEPLLAAKAFGVTFADMYVPAMLVAESAFATRFIVGVVCISEILFFSASIPCIMATNIPLKLKDIIVIWFWRVVFSVLLTAPLVYLFF